MSLHPRRRSVRFHLVTVAWLTAVWVLLWGELSAANVLGGAAVAVVVTATLPMPAIEFHGRIHLVPLLYLLWRFGVDLVVASAQVAARALDTRRAPRGAVLAVPLRSHSDLYLTLTGELCSLVPGSLVVEAHRVTGMLYIHVLDVESAGGIEAARTHVLDTEARLLRAIASDEELAEAGLTRRPLRAGHARVVVAP
jgi:multicomponent Na+:H+ antiporter subunit E